MYKFICVHTERCVALHDAHALLAQRLKDSTFQRFSDFLEDKDLAKQQISEAIAAGRV